MDSYQQSSSTNVPSRDVGLNPQPQSLIERRFAPFLKRTKDPLGLNLLHDPPEPRIDLIFVHGLGGGSHKTWNISNDPASFWPKEWLPREKGFENARIYSYGYPSGWTGKNQVKSILGFGRDLLQDILGHSSFREAPDAYILAKQQATYKEVSMRIGGIIFLGSPHRGAQSVYLLKSLLHLPGMNGSKKFVDELVPDSSLLEVLFNAILDSGFKTDLGITRQLIVEPNSAVLGLPSEKIRRLNTDHRHMCKFDNRRDPSYKILRGECLAAISHAHKANLIPRGDLERISRYLCVPPDHRDPLLDLSLDKLDGSCDWLIQRPTFRDWLNRPGFESESPSPDARNMQQPPKVFWLRGRPGAGKSMTAAHVVEYMEDNNLDCIFYSFTYGDKARSSLCNALRSLAVQMASINAPIRYKLIDMARQRQPIDLNLRISIWRSVFETVIMQERFQQPHYWVIDALDECDDFNVLVSLISKLDALPIRVFITSRPIPEIEHLLQHHNIPVFKEEIKIEDSLGDISLYLKGCELSFRGSSGGDAMTSVLQESNGCFLWVALVVDHLRETVRRLITSEVVPVRMYEQILQRLMTMSPSDIKMAKAVFRWTICARRPLQATELLDMLYLDVKDKLFLLEAGIGPLCGHLVYVDDTSGVQTLHHTVGPFLTGNCPVTEFAMEKEKEHARIAEVCLTFLAGKGFCASDPRIDDLSGFPADLSPFADYASSHFSEHILQSAVETDEPLLSLCTFLQSSNVLEWIGRQIQSQNLSLLARTAENLKAYLIRRLKHSLPLDKEVHTVEAWIHDLFHIGTLVTNNLLAIPKAVYFLLPPLCPRKSATYSQFGGIHDCFTVVGIAEDWDDRLASILYPEDEALSLACNANYFGVGLSNGSIFIYQSTTCEYVRRLQHPGAVIKLAFAGLHPFLASCSSSKLNLWDMHDGSCVWSACRSGNLDPMALSFSNDDSTIYIATKKGLSVFQTLTGTELRHCTYYSKQDFFDEELSNLTWNARLLPELDQLALISRNAPIVIWNAAEESIAWVVERRDLLEGAIPHANAVAFRRDRLGTSMVVAYNSGDLVLYHPRRSDWQNSFPLLAHTLAVSPGGRTLATGDTHGIIHLFDFDTLNLLYRITSDTSRVREIVFDSSGLRFFDLRDDRCNAWQPSILASGKGSDVTLTVAHSAPIQQQKPTFRGDDHSISAIACDHEGDSCLFCGRSDGSIAVFNMKTGCIAQELCRHVNSGRVHLLDWNTSGSLLTSADTSWRIICRKLSRKHRSEWYTEKILLDKRTRNAILQVLTNQSGNRLLVSTTSTDIVWSLDTHSTEINRFMPREKRQWVSHPTDPDHLVLIRSGKAYVFDWLQFQMISGEDGIMLQSLPIYDIPFSQVVVCEQANKIATVSQRMNNEGRYSSIIRLWDAVHIHPEATNVPSVAQHENFLCDVKVILGTFELSLLFIDEQDWVCSLNIENTQQEHFYTRHFFLPFTWYRNKELVYNVTAKGSITFGVGEKVVIFHDGLGFRVPVPFKGVESGSIE
ncbi:WD domain, G-beta repeat containing protein [Coccidioides posadasii C735 delta SOWgp]|uniref:WD domain, G-beta repeat containing protein n=1 Tax=Coccidioides posadasii (strain C735) TaxID=222929 RepID=C5P679_COCP7|nr:WD domain, G-beta repeat containing protein [Coccidioides posadasii C735 delta SOWgp]EER26929.1 WD domain, G-beta repeat containing protein [Coccidioides posadasii C735 delta SOWgp]|eukprot:XP_003069074.1 WD domain, G-beta repeat containing protein [Coccidioides posadasii C735 delta SOWgp]